MIAVIFSSFVAGFCASTAFGIWLYNHEYGVSRTTKISIVANLIMVVGLIALALINAQAIQAAR